MKTGRFVCLILLIACVGIYYNGITLAADSVKEQKEEKKETAKAIDAYVEISTDHPEFEEGVTCNDCHEIKLDANTTATQVWLSGESPGRKAGEGVMPQDQIVERNYRGDGWCKGRFQDLCAGDQLEQCTPHHDFRIYPGS